MTKKREPVTIDVQPEELQREIPPRPEPAPDMRMRLGQFAENEIESNVQDIIAEFAPLAAIAVAAYLAAPHIRRILDNVKTR